VCWKLRYEQGAGGGRRNDILNMTVKPGDFAPFRIKKHWNINFVFLFG
jgi:hypothetical protein